MDDIAKRIRETRIKKGYTLDDFASKTKISKTTLQRYETGYTTIKSNRLVIIADALDVSPAFLMGWESEDESSLDCDFINAIFKKLDYELNYDAESNNYYFLKNDEMMGYAISPNELNKIKEDILNYTEFKLISIQNKLDKKRKEVEKNLSNSNSEKE